MKKLIYMDNGATTFPKPEDVYKRIDYINRNVGVNPGRGHYNLSIKAMDIIESTREKISSDFNITKENIIFTSSATIAINQVLWGLEWNENKTVYISPYEHNSICRTLFILKEKYNFNIRKMPVIHETKEIDVEKLEYEFINIKPDVVCVNHISNVTGYILPVEDIFPAAKKYEAVTILDAAQSIGLMKLDLIKNITDFIVFTGHKKLYGPIGAGGIICNNIKIKLKPLLAGGTGSDSLSINMPEESPLKFEPGSLNVSAIGGLEAGIDFVNGKPDILEKEKKLTSYMVEQLKKIKNVVCYLPPSDKHISIVSFNIKGFKACEVGEILDSEFNISVRTGYHCVPYVHEILGDKDFYGTVRAGIGYFNTEKDIDKLVSALKSF